MSCQDTTCCSWIWLCHLKSTMSPFTSCTENQQMPMNTYLAEVATQLTLSMVSSLAKAFAYYAGANLCPMPVDILLSFSTSFYYVGIASKTFCTVCTQPKSDTMVVLASSLAILCSTGLLSIKLFSKWRILAPQTMVPSVVPLRSISTFVQPAS